LPIVLGICSMFMMHHPGARSGVWMRAPVATTMMLLTIAVLTPWALRNYSKLHRWVWLTTNGGITRYDGFNAEATGASDQSFIGQPEMILLRSMSEVERDEYLSARANRWIADTWHSRPTQL